ncbi:MAG: hypothetical protein V4508_00925 [Pseudomonadota bacterium]
MKHAVKRGALLAASIAAMAWSGPVAAEGVAASASTVADSVHCVGINSCKSTSDCKSAENACKGKNVCKGHGFSSTSKADCAKKGGKVQQAPKSAK